MKKKISLLFSTIMAVVLSTTFVSASDLRNQLTILPDGLNGSIQYDVAYENELTSVTATLLVDDNSIAKILSQKPGNTSPGGESKLSTFYFGIDPNLIDLIDPSQATGVKFIKRNIMFGEGRSITTLEGAYEKVDQLLDDEPVANAKADEYVWPMAVIIEYSLDNGTTWQRSASVGIGAKTIEQDLLDNLGLSSASDLEYGKNFRFRMYDTAKSLFAWEALDASGVPLENVSREYILVNYVIKFPVQGKEGNAQVYFITLEDAIDSGNTEITVNRDITTSGDIEIPLGTKVTVANGATLEIPNGYTLTNNGTISGTVKENGTTKTYYSANVNITGTGSASLDYNNYEEGDTVTITVNPALGHIVKEVSGVDGITKVSENTYTFEMPNKNVNISVVFEAIDYSIVAAIPENGELTVGKNTATVGEVVTIKTGANEGYYQAQLSVWDVTNERYIPVIDGKFTMPAGNVEIYVYYQAIDYGIILEDNESGKIFADTTIANINDVVELNIVPNKGYELKELTVTDLYTGDKITVKDNKFVMPAGYVLVAAEFKLIDYAVTVKATENGKVLAVKTNANMGDVVTVNPIPDKGYILKGLTIVNLATNEKIDLKDSKFIMPNGDVEVTAIFEEINYTVTTKTVENGKITVDKANAKVGEIVTIDIEADKGYILNELTVYDVTNKVKIDVKDGKFTMPAGDVEVKATFIAEKTPATLDAINVYFGVAVISLLGLLISLKGLKRFN